LPKERKLKKLQNLFVRKGQKETKFIQESKPTPLCFEREKIEKIMR